MLSRRDLVGKLAAGAAGVAVWTVSGRRASATLMTKDAPAPHDHAPIEELPVADAVEQAAPASVASEALPASTARPPWELLRPLSLGSVIAYGWRLVDLTGPVGGACVLTLQSKRGHLQRVHLCRNDGSPRGLVYTKKFDLVVMNGGQGGLKTEENMGLAVAAVSHVLAANENSGHSDVVAALLPHAERVKRFADASAWTLR